MSGDKPWDRAWTLQEIRDHAANWSLAGDVGMLGYLTQLSQEIIERTQSTTASIDSLFADLDQTQTEIANVTNSFNALAHTQFVENRVAEEEVCAAPAPPSGESAKQPAEIAQAQMQEVLRNSFAFLDEMFETVEVPVDSDSEDDDDSSPSANGGSQVILKAINPYASRRLPHIIGTKEFEEDDTLGLLLTPSDDEQSDGEQSPLEELPRSRNQDVSESSSECEGGGRATVSLPSDDEDGDGLFSPKPPPQPPTMPPMSRPVSFADELASRLGGGGVTAAPTPKPPANQNPQNFPALDQREPPDLFGGDSEEEDSIFGSSRGPFSGGRGLFDDLAESGIPAVPGKPTVVAPAPVEPVKKATPAPQPAEKPPSQNRDPLGDLFGDDTEDELFSAPKSTIKASSKSSVLLFSDEEDLFAAPSPRMRSQTSQQPHDLFSEPNQPLAPQPRGQGSQPGGPPKSQVSPKPLPRARREESPKLEGEVAPTKKLPAGAVSIFGGQQVFPTSALRRQPSSSSDEEVVNPSPIKPAEQPSKPEQARKVFKQPEAPSVVSRTEEPESVKPKSVSSKTASSLFDDNDSEDDLFSKTKPPESKPKQPSKTSKPQQKISLFGDSEEEDFIIPSRPKQTESKTNLFANESSKPNLFPTEQTKSIFDDPSDIKPVAKTSLFTDVEPPKSQTKTVEKTAKSKVSLFNESDSEDEVLFSSASSGSSKSSKLLDASKSATGRHGLFDDNWLFTAQKTETSNLFGESDDLFSTKKVSKVTNQQSLDSNESLEKSKTVEKIPETIKNISETKSDVKTASKLGDLFSDNLDSPDDLFTTKTQDNIIDDDLFSSKTVKSSQSNISKKVPKKTETQNKPVDDLFSSETKEDLFPTETAKKIETLKNKPIDNLFRSEPVEKSDELFPVEITKKTNPATSIQDDLFGSATISKTEDRFTIENKKEIEPLASKNKQLDDLFGAETSTKSEESLPEKIKKESQASKNKQFDELFGAETSTKSEESLPEKITKKKEIPTSKNIDDLFNSPDLEPVENFDADDLFGSKSVVAKKEIVKTVAPKTEEPVEKPSGVSDPSVSKSTDLNLTKSILLFDSDEDTDIFSPKTKIDKPVKPEVASRKPKETSPKPMARHQEKLFSEEVIPTEIPKENIPVLDDTDGAKPSKIRSVPPRTLNVPKTPSLSTEEKSDEKVVVGASRKVEKSTDVESSLKPEEKDTVKISPVQRGLNLNINPLALLPGGKSVKPYQRSTSENLSSPTTPTEQNVPTEQSVPVEKSEVVKEVPEFVKEVPEFVPEVPQIVTSQVLSPIENAVSFEEAATSNILHCPGKDRIRIQHKRKASTRRSRNISTKSSTSSPAVVSTAPETTEEPPKSEPPKIEPSKPEPPKPVPRSPRNYMTPPLLDREPPPLPPSNPMSPSTDEEDVFDLPSEDLGDDEDSLFKPVPNSTLSPFATTPEVAVNSKINLFPDSDTSPSFTSPNEEKSNVDLFKSTNDLFSETKSTPKTETPIDIFGEKMTPSVPPSLDDQFTDKSTTDSLFTETNVPSVKTTHVKDDLFESPKPTASNQKDDLFGKIVPPALSSSSNDELFSEKTITSPPPLTDDLFEEKSNIKTQPPYSIDDRLQDNLFGEESTIASPPISTKLQDNLFGEKSTIKSPLNKQTNRKEDDLFGEIASPNISNIEDNLFNTNSSLNLSTVSKPETLKDDLFGEIASPMTSNVKDDLFGTNAPLDTSSKPASKDTDLFADSPMTSNVKDDLFGTNSPLDTSSKPASKDTDLFANSPMTSNVKDDLFGTNSPLDTSSKPASKDTDLFANSPMTSNVKDDLFGTNAPLDTSSKPASKDTDLFADQKGSSSFSSSQDEDLFSTSGKTKTSKTKDLGTTTKKASSVATKQAAVVDLFSDPSDEDFFVASPKPKPQTAPPASKSVTKPAAKSTPKPTAKTAVVDLFGEGSDEDDLFAASSRSSVAKSSTTKRKTDISKPKSEVTKSVSKPVKNEDFEDPLMSFQNDD